MHIDYHVSFEKHYYSVPYNLIGKEVDIRATEQTVESSTNASDGLHTDVRLYRVAIPPKMNICRLPIKSTVTGHRSVFCAGQRKLAQLPTRLIAAVLETRRHPQQAYRSCLGILGLGKRYTNVRLEAACRRALPAGIQHQRRP